MKDLRHLSSIISTMDNENWHDIEDYFNKTPQLTHLGISVNLQNINSPECWIKEIKDFHLGGLGGAFINGGIISAIVDLSIGLTALPYLKEGNFATTQLNINMAKSIEAQPLHTKSKILQQIGSKLFVETIVFATGTIKTRIK